MMTIQEFAKMLNGREMGEEISREEILVADKLGFTVVFGYSDDNTELAGAIDEEVGCLGGGVIYLDGQKTLEGCEDECSHWRLAKEKCKTIEAVWSDEVLPAWTYETDIPHATFNVMEDGEVWCRGIVFDIKSLEEEV